MNVRIAAPGIILLGLLLTVLAGQTLTAYNPQQNYASSGLPGVDHPASAPMSQLGPSVLARGDESVSAYAGRISDIVHNATYTCDSARMYRSPLERLIGSGFEALGYEQDWTQGIIGADLICGICHQRAMTLTDILRRNGIAAETYGINGHVLTWYVDEEGLQYFVDPDYGSRPYIYTNDLPSLDLAMAEAYKDVVIDYLPLVNMVGTREDNGRYYNYDRQVDVSKNRSTVHWISTWIAAISGGVGLLLLIAGTVMLAWRRSPRRTSELPPIRA